MNDLKQMAFTEAEKLNEAATEEEKGRLDAEELNPISFSSCIYGQLTGDCYSLRASTLLKRCAVPYVKGGDLENPDAKPIKRKSFNGRWNNPGSQAPHSALEYYICQPNADIAGIVKVIKGE